MKLSAYDTGPFYDELVRPDGQARSGAAPLLERVTSLPEGELVHRQQAAERDLLNLGITFTVYGDEAGTERIFPFDILPRIVGAADWATIEHGLKQRIQALNLFIDDIYHAQRILKDGGRAGRPHPVGAQLSAAVRRAQPAAGNLVPRQRHRLGA